MHDKERLEDFYSELKDIHKRSFPDWSFGKFMYNFLNWMRYEKNIDIFFLDEYKMLKYIKEYANTHSPYCRDWK